MTTGEIIAQSVESLWEKIIGFVPALVVAIIVLVLGWVLGNGLGSLVQKILEAIKIDNLANSLGLDKLSARTGKKLSVAAFGNWLVKWFFIVATFVAAADILELSQVSSFLYTAVLPYFGSVIVAVAIMLIGIIAANFLQGLVRHSLNASGLQSAESLSLITKWAVLIFAFLATLSQLGVAAAFVQDLFRALVAMLAIAGGIAFGMGGREHAKKVLDAVEKDLMGK
ncbi:MAG: hypothetical protein A3K06_03850 [Candidatus Doudnabacteria bacterium RIFCSPHIGHO2_01_52_17]|uniref:Small-conductance mechanosensitive ion channel n=1 Tax=Candidatus Doudnabacteria bacterium RIFCSPHIGHO2_01_52_17 TaxID=1817820 RepID=A0A1F5NAC8_9BACT|nr:MAG: hypothetical protein A3K06_03850 [Candidatus Doudnabacteria bacterium RIFCSPHIGHO2_01_52_17]